MSDAEDIEAINAFFHSQEPQTPAARAAFDEWVRWYEATKPGPFGWWSDADFDHARNLRNAFNRANAVTAADKATVERVITTGQTSEQQRGETDRRNAEGGIVEQSPGVTHAWWFWPLVAASATAVTVAVAPKVLSIYLGKNLS